MLLFRANKCSMWSWCVDSSTSLSFFALCAFPAELLKSCECAFLPMAKLPGEAIKLSISSIALCLSLLCSEALSDGSFDDVEPPGVELAGVEFDDLELFATDYTKTMLIKSHQSNHKTHLPTLVLPLSPPKPQHHVLHAFLV